MDFITAPLVVGIVFYFTYMVFELFARRKERMSLIEKMGRNLTPVDSSVLKSQFCSLLPVLPKRTFTTLRMGCLFVGLGLGLLVGLFIALEIELSGIMSEWRRASLHSVAYGASVLFFGGFGLIISYIIESKSVKKEKDTDEPSQG
jgi:ABC-type nitrate/sulfonate/bicarbonate transport system permease component